jgi:hypothetical protein
MPMVRTILPPIELCWWPNTCSKRARTFERVVFSPKRIDTHQCRREGLLQASDPDQDPTENAMPRAVHPSDQ